MNVSAVIIKQYIYILDLFRLQDGIASASGSELWRWEKQRMETKAQQTHFWLNDIVSTSGHSIGQLSLARLVSYLHVGLI